MLTKSNIEGKYSWVVNKDIEDRLNADFYSSENIILDNIIKKSEYKRYKIKDLCSKVTQGPNPQYTNNYTKYLCLKTRNLNNYEINLNECSYIEKEQFFLNKNYILEKGDILVGIKGEGSIGKSNVFLNEGYFIFTREIGLIRTKPDMINKFYLSAFLRSKYGKGLFERGISGSSGQMTLNTEYIKNIDVIVPDKKIQDYVGDKILKSNELKDKADILSKNAESLLNEALALDEYNKNSKEYKNKFNWIRRVDIKDRIDSTYYDPRLMFLTEKFKDCTMVKLSDIVSYKKGYAFKSKDMISEPNSLKNKIFKVSDLNNNWIDYDSLVGIYGKEAEKYNDFYLENEDIVLAMTGTIGKSTLIENKPYNLLLNQNAVRLRKKSNHISMYYVDMILKSVYFQNLINKSAFQSVQPFVSMEFLNEVEIPVINKEVIEEISDARCNSLKNLYLSRDMIKEAINNVEDLIEGNFDMT